MSTFEGAVLEQTVAVAYAHKIEPPSLLAVVEVESDGKSLEIDGKTPCLLFERHIFYRELTKARKLDARARAVAQGLANTSWQPKTQYKDQGPSKGRLALIAKARAIDDECALLSASWGVGQQMGFNGVEMGFPSARAMVDYMIAGGVPAQVECLVREVEKKKLTPRLNAHNWAAFARTYNGPGYLTNRYDTKMAAAYARWKARKLPAQSAPKPVDVSKELAPPPPVKPPVVTPTQAKVGAGSAAVAGGFWATVHNLPWPQIALAAALVVAAIVTVVVLWRRHQAANVPQLGVLSAIRED